MHMGKSVIEQGILVFARRQNTVSTLVKQLVHLEPQYWHYLNILYVEFSFLRVSVDGKLLSQCSLSQQWYRNTLK